MDSDYVTKADLRQALRETEERLTESIRDAQTEILRAFYNWARPVEARLKPVEEHAQRPAWLEERIAEIERKQLMGGDQ